MHLFWEQKIKGSNPFFPIIFFYLYIHLDIYKFFNFYFSNKKMIIKKTKIKKLKLKTSEKNKNKIKIRLLNKIINE